jgi:death-on-curing protein
MNYFGYETLIEIHERILEVSGGMPGVKDEGLLRSPLGFITDEVYYPLFADKLTHLVYSLIKNHGFNDGNKRTALAAGAMLLMLNGYDNFVEYYFLLFEPVMVLVADDKISKEQLHILFADTVERGVLSESSKIIIIEAFPDGAL